MKKLLLSYTCTALGAATATAERAILGRLVAIEYQPENTATGATLVFTCENGSTSKAVLTQANAGTANRMWYPRDLVHAVADGAALTGTAGADRNEVVLSGIPKLVVSSGGNATHGKAIIYYRDIL